MNLALVSDAAGISMAQLVQVASAVNVQLQRDLKPTWNRDVYMEAYESEASIPPGYFMVKVTDHIGAPGALGYHSDVNGTPYALVQSGDGWETTVSHEALEMGVDSEGDMVVLAMDLNGNSIRPLAEICDPVEAFGYEIEGIVVSDFVVPSYYVNPGIGARRSFLGILTKPLNLAWGGYLSYLAGDGNWYQRTNFGGLKTQFIGSDARLREGCGSIREAIEQWNQKNHPKDF